MSLLQTFRKATGTHPDGGMGIAEDQAGRWAARVRTTGRVRPIELRSDEILVVLFLTTEQHSEKDEQRERLEEILTDSRTAPPRKGGHRLLPPRLHEVIIGLLDWCAEVDTETKGRVFWALVLHDSDVSPVVAHIGGVEPELTSAGRPFAPFSLALKGPNDSQARTLCLRTGRVRNVSLTWTAGEEGSRSVPARVSKRNGGGRPSRPTSRRRPRETPSRRRLRKLSSRRRLRRLRLRRL